MTVSWYKDYYQGAEDQSMYEFTVEQINEYMQLAENKGIEWSI
jgi:hypothetical protein